MFRDRVRAVLRELDRARMEVKALSRSPGGRIDLGMPLSISQALTAHAGAGVHRELPGVALRVIDGWTGFIIEWLMRGRLDLGVIYDHTLKSDVLRIEPLAAEEHFLVCRADDPLARRERIPLAEVAELPLALPSREHGLRFAVEQIMQTIGARATTSTPSSNSIVGLKQLAQEGGVYTILPRGEMEEELSAAGSRSCGSSTRRSTAGSYRRRGRTSGRSRRRCRRCSTSPGARPRASSQPDAGARDSSAQRSTGDT